MARLSKEKRDRLILVIILTVAISIGLWYGIITTRKERLKETRAAIRTVIDKLEKAKNLVKQTGKAEDQVAAAANKLKAVEDSMASGVDHYTWAILLLEKARARHDVKIIEVTRPVKGEVGLLAQFPYQATMFTVRGSGHYHDFGKFLADFENSFPYFRVQNLSLAPGFDSAAGTDTPTAASGEENLSFRMEIVALIKPGP
jgi:Tfp pilus assembly protein PilO